MSIVNNSIAGLTSLQVSQALMKISTLTNKECLSFMEEHVEYMDSKEIATKIIEKNPLILYMFSNRLQTDPELVEKAIKQNPLAIQHIPANFLTDHLDLVELALTKSPEAYQILPESTKRMDEVVNFFVTRMASKYESKTEMFYKIPAEYFVYSKGASQKRTLVVDFLKDDGCKLSRLSLDWKDDFEIVKFAVINDGEAIRYASTRLQDNDELAHIVVNSARSSGVEHLSHRLKMNKDLVLTALSHNGNSLAHFVDKKGFNYAEDYECALTAVQNNGLALQSVSTTTKNYREIALAAVKQNKLAVRHIRINAEAFSVDILDEVLHKDVFYLATHLSSRVPENQKASIVELRSLMRTKPQHYLLSSIKNALNSSLIPPEFSELNATCVDLLLEPASIQTLYSMKDASVNFSVLCQYLMEHLDNKKLLGVQQSETVNYKKGKQRKILKASM